MTTQRLMTCKLCGTTFDLETQSYKCWRCGTTYDYDEAVCVKDVPQLIREMIKASSQKINSPIIEG